MPCFAAFKATKPIALSVVVTLLVSAGQRNIAIEPVSRMGQDWWHARFDAKQVELRHAPVDLLWLGDSITQNWERSAPESWQDFAPVWQRFYGDRHAVDLGFKGDSTCHLLWRLEHGELDAISPRVAIVLIGANNFGHIHTDADETFDGIQVILDVIHRRLPQTHIVLLGVLPSMRSDWVSKNTIRLNDHLQGIPAHRSYVTFANVGDLFVTSGRVDATKFIDPRLTPPAPPLHPTAQVQAEIAGRIEPIVSRRLQDHVHQ